MKPDRTEFENVCGNVFTFAPWFGAGILGNIESLCLRAASIGALSKSEGDMEQHVEAYLYYQDRTLY